MYVCMSCVFACSCLVLSEVRRWLIWNLSSRWSQHVCAGNCLWVLCKNSVTAELSFPPLHVYYVCAPHECLVPSEGRGRYQIPWNWNYRWILSHHVGNWELNLGPLEEQVFLTTEPFLHCCRIFDHTVSLEMGLFTGKNQVFSCGVTQP